MKKQHIIIIATHFYPRISGYALATTNFIKALDTYGEGVTYTILSNDACPSSSDELEINNGSVLRFSLPRWLPFAVSMLVYELWLYRSIRRIANRNVPCMIVFETMERSIALYLLTHSKLKSRIVVRLHGSTETEYFIWGRRLQLMFRGFLSRRAAKRVPAIFSTTEYYNDFFRKWFLRENLLVAACCRFFVIENIVFYADSNNPVRDEVLLKYGVQHDSFFLTLGRLDSVGILQKGFQDLIAALYWLRSLNRPLPRGFKVLMIGDGSFRNSIACQSRELGIDEWVLIVPSVRNDEVRLLQACSAAVVLMSRFDGLSMFALESLAAGAPLLLSTFGGLQGLVEPGRNGFLAPPQNIPAIAEALYGIASLSPDMREKMRQVSHTIYKERFSPSTIIKKFLTAVTICSQDIKSTSLRSSGTDENEDAPLSRGSE